MSESLALVKIEERPNALAEIIKTLGANHGEKALMALCEAEGEQAGALVLAEMTPVSLNNLLNEFDYTRPSVAMDLLSPKKIAELLQATAKYWPNTDELHLVQDYVTDFLTSLVFYSEDKNRQNEIISEIAQTEWGLYLLAMVMLDRIEDEDQSDLEEEDDESLRLENSEKLRIEAPTASWQELKVVIATMLPGIKRAINDVLDSYQGKSFGQVMTHLMDCLKDFSQEVPDQEVVKNPSQDDDYFTPID